MKQYWIKLVDPNRKSVVQCLIVAHYYYKYIVYIRRPIETNNDIGKADFFPTKLIARIAISRHKKWAKGKRAHIENPIYSIVERQVCSYI